MLIAACSQVTSPTTTAARPLLGADTPKQAVRTWLTELSDGDYQSTARVVHDHQLALLAAAEGQQPAEVLATLRDGVPSTMRHNFWEAFTEGFPAFSGEQLEGLVVGEADAFRVDGRRFAAVTLVLPRRVGSTEVVTSRDGEDRWWVDLFASFGPAFARPLRSWLETIPRANEGAWVWEAVAAERLSLQAALQRSERSGELAALLAELS